MMQFFFTHGHGGYAAFCLLDPDEFDACRFIYSEVHKFPAVRRAR